MKNFLFAIALLFALTLNAQVTGPKITSTAVGYLKTTPTHAATDTITNAIVETQYGIINGPNIHATFQPTFTKISGTVAGTAALQGSVDGVSYTTIGSAFTLTDVASQSTSFVVAPSSYQYYRLLITPSGTQSTKVITPVLVRKQP